MRKLKALVAASEASLRRSLVQVVAEIHPAAVTEAINGADAYQALQAVLPDLAIVSADLPGIDGLQLCHRLRALKPLEEIPVVLLGPRGDQKRKYQAFYVGASEYLELPLDRIELSFRLKVHLKGWLKAASLPDSWAVGGLELDAGTRRAKVGERTAVLTPSEFALLSYLALHPGVPFSTERLLIEALKSPPGLGNPQLIHTHMRNLRKKLEADPASPSSLLRHPAGYMLAPAP